jgi:hypothetical protein
MVFDDNDITAIDNIASTQLRFDSVALGVVPTEQINTSPHHILSIRYGNTPETSPRALHNKWPSVEQIRQSVRNSRMHETYHEHWQETIQHN